MTEKTTKLARMVAQHYGTVTAAALACGVNVSQFSLYVRGARVSRRTADKIAAGFGVSAGDIWPEFGRDGGK